jgi:hypothetical protein
MRTITTLFPCSKGAMLMKETQGNASFDIDYELTENWVKARESEGALCSASLDSIV